MKNKKTRYAQSRLRRNILSLSAFLLFAAIVGLDNCVIHHKPAPVNHKTETVDDWNKYNEKSFTVAKVIDGDTIDINAPDGNYTTTRIRLLGIDTPETKNPHTDVMYFGPQASKFTTDMVLGQQVIIIMDKVSKPRDKYRRLLCYVRLINGRILNEELVSQGFAYADTRFPHSFLGKYIQLEETAKKVKKGLWKEVRQNQLPKWYKNKTKNSNLLNHACGG
jgi:endonuclease YncB( thermonuclease family)